MYRIPLIAVMVIAFGCLNWRDSIAAGETEVPASASSTVNDIEWSQMTVRILDPEEHPVVGAVVRPWALRASNRHFLWLTSKYGSPGRSTTDPNGLASVVFPKLAKGDDEPTVFAVTLSVAHSDFCAKRVDVFAPVDDESPIPDVALERGFRLRIAAVLPGRDEPLQECHALLEGDSEVEPDFVRQPDGWLQSIPVKKSRRWFQVVWLPPDKPPQFGKRQSWSPDDPASREVRVEVHPGVRVVGKLSDDVERPIERGRVVAWCGSPIKKEIEGNPPSNESLSWVETASIAKDGTFEFPSLPAGYMAQFYAFANDSVSAQPTDEEYETCCRWFAANSLRRSETVRFGQVRHLVGEKIEFTLEMEPAGQIQVKCINAEGHPVAGVDVWASAAQVMVPNSSTDFCLPVSTAAGLRNSDIEYMNFKINSFWATTNTDGIALIRSLPAGKMNVRAENSRWKREKIEAVAVESNETTEVEVRLQPRP
jgi:hypothetical protein